MDTASGEKASGDTQGSTVPICTHGWGLQTPTGRCEIKRVTQPEGAGLGQQKPHFGKLAGMYLFKEPGICTHTYTKALVYTVISKYL